VKLVLILLFFITILFFKFMGWAVERLNARSVDMDMFFNSYEPMINIPLRHWPTDTIVSL
jgi:hypothetical protein